jgi:hypothetical protein
MSWHFSGPTRRLLVWVCWVVIALCLLPVLDGPAFGVVVPLSALILALVPGMLPPTVRRSDRADLLAVLGLYVAVVALLRMAFIGFTTRNVLGLFLSFAGALLVGVAGPVIYTVWAADDHWLTSGSAPTT